MTIYLKEVSTVRVMMEVDGETHDWTLYGIVSIRLAEYCEYGASLYELIGKDGDIYKMYADSFMLK